MANLVVKVICATFATILALALVVVFTILIYNEFAESPQEYENEKNLKRVENEESDSAGCAYRYLVGNGICDDESNTKECDLDGGDCCGDAIVTRFCQDCKCYDKYGNVRTTTDPSDSTTTKKVCAEPWLTANGFCNPENDNFACDYDGGDCEHVGCPMPQYINDGECDLDNFIPECNFDGEDCKNLTETTTSTTTTITTVTTTSTTTTKRTTTKASVVVWEKPATTESTMSTTSTTTTPVSTTTTERSHKVGDGICDDDLNTKSQDYDGGDCCSGYSSYEFCYECKCRQIMFMDLSDLYPRCPSNYLPYMGDNLCHNLINHVECGFDLGDCCKGKDGICWLHDLEWPEEGTKNCSDRKSIRNGICEDDLNIVDCGLDGYDCCNPYSDFTKCLECKCKLPYRPENGTEEEQIAQALLEKEYPGCEKPEYIGDMFCDDVTNTKGCNYDGGDCCDPYSFFFLCHHCVCFDMPEVKNSEYVDTGPPKSK